MVPPGPRSLLRWLWSVRALNLESQAASTTAPSVPCVRRLHKQSSCSTIYPEAETSIWNVRIFPRSLARPFGFRGPTNRFPPMQETTKPHPHISGVCPAAARWYRFAFSAKFSPRSRAKLPNRSNPSALCSSARLICRTVCTQPISLVVVSSSAPPAATRLSLPSPLFCLLPPRPSPSASGLSSAEGGRQALLR